MRRKAKKLGLSYWDGITNGYHKTCGSTLKLGFDADNALKCWCYKCNKIVNEDEQKSEDFVEFCKINAIRL